MWQCQSDMTCIETHCMIKMEEVHRSHYLSHAKRALYHLSYTPCRVKFLPTLLIQGDQKWSKKAFGGSWTCAPWLAKSQIFSFLALFEHFLWKWSLSGLWKGKQITTSRDKNLTNHHTDPKTCHPPGGINPVQFYTRFCPGSMEFWSFWPFLVGCVKIRSIAGVTCVRTSGKASF